MKGMMKWWRNLGQPPISLEKRVEQLKKEVEAAEKHTDLVEEAVAAQKRIAAAEERRRVALQSIKSAKRFSTTQLMIGGAAIIVLLWLISMIRC